MKTLSAIFGFAVLICLISAIVDLKERCDKLQWQLNTNAARTADLDGECLKEINGSLRQIGDLQKRVSRLENR